MKNPLYSGDPKDWDSLPLLDQIEYIRKHLCTGPGGQSSQDMTQRQRMNKAFNDAAHAIRSAYGMGLPVEDRAYFENRIRELTRLLSKRPEATADPA